MLFERFGGGWGANPIEPLYIACGTRKGVNLYVTDAERGDAIIAGVFKAGPVWTDVKGLGPDRATRLAAALKAQGIILDAGRQ